jgi:hypothetical protein
MQGKTASSLFPAKKPPLFLENPGICDIIEWNKYEMKGDGIERTQGQDFGGSVLRSAHHGAGLSDGPVALV